MAGCFSDCACSGCPCCCCCCCCCCCSCSRCCCCCFGCSTATSAELLGRIAVAEERWLNCEIPLEREPREKLARSELLDVGVTGLVGLLPVEGPGFPSLVRFLLRNPRACINGGSSG